LFEVEKLFGFWLVAHGVDHEVEIVEREVFAIIRMLFKDDRETFHREDSLQDVEVPAEQEIGLHYHLLTGNLGKGRVLLDCSLIGTGVEMVNLPQALLHFLGRENHRLVYLGNQFG
jgi:hypothetical protein